MIASDPIASQLQVVGWFVVAMLGALVLLVGYMWKQQALKINTLTDLLNHYITTTELNKMVISRHELWHERKGDNA